MPAISVIVPVYRAEAFLKTCTDSILGQTFGDLELLLVDDGSPDRSGALCDAIAAADSRVRVFHRENGGVSAARNLALEKAEGEYVYFVDSDDWIAPDTLETLYTALRESGADTAGCGLRYVDQNKIEGTAEPPILPAGVYGREEILTGIVDRLLGDRLSRNAVNGYVVRFLFTRSLLEGMAFQGAYLEDELFLWSTSAAPGNWSRWTCPYTTTTGTRPPPPTTICPDTWTPSAPSSRPRRPWRSAAAWRSAFPCGGRTPAGLGS